MDRERSGEREERTEKEEDEKAKIEEEEGVRPRYIIRQTYSEDKLSSLYIKFLAIYETHCLNKAPRVSPRGTHCIAIPCPRYRVSSFP